ncbi:MULTISPECIES: flagellar hook-associated protein FlgK [Paenibacillus]|uniref:Flagellar hook-associated protein 1 n=1 Tax=Paenibacillus naphthalenovorans TaxID=162209 RepID=A0A0U2VMG0_9BACL|nr:MULTISPECIES: flagellar hook-associated protein FlgK [Paenibacillus]ALS24483.1 flagellar hook protein FlgK [Paenibacillus naphthalenovorans]NTZ20888.1 flagellar hook-associated protein FlgK [Paenibacillus sp. JMULE4]GCL73674.1 flagellar hook-associated protein FlgK [Paenibacillus naphthalenovorans]SDJ95748.1 flagellar hook-associated protein 1 FlgK [Paenibacillus naphthalenovorans]
MRSTFHGLETAKRSLFTQQAALQTTGHNIANANTAGYSRQVVNMNASRPIEAVGMTRSNVPGQLGTGVEFGSITRIRENFLDNQFRNENKSFGSWSVRQDTLEKLEKIINEPSDTGIRTVIDNFWKAWSDLSKDPENTDGRKIVRENALALADAFNATSKQLNDLSADLTENINVKVSQINTIASTISNLNKEIQRVEGIGDNANDLRDQRDLLTDELSKIVNIQVVDTDQGYTITMGNTAIVAGGTPSVMTSDILNQAFASGDLNGGEVYGMIVSRDQYVASYISELDTIANTLVNGKITVTIPKDSVLPEGTVLNGVTYSGSNRTLTSDLTVEVNGFNGLHKLGYNLGNPSFGVPFFDENSGQPVTAATFKVNSAIVDNPNLIATSMRTIGTGANEKVVIGNNTAALLLSQVRDAKFSFGTGANASMATVDDYFRSVVGQVGVQTKEAQRQATNQKILVDQVESRRQSVSGVSLDEEMSNMIKFQHAYNAAARAMTTFDETLDKVINGMGVVGR